MPIKAERGVERAAEQSVDAFERTFHERSCVQFKRFGFPSRISPASFFNDVTFLDRLRESGQFPAQLVLFLRMVLGGMLQMIAAVALR